MPTPPRHSLETFVARLADGPEPDLDEVRCIRRPPADREPPAVTAADTTPEEKHGFRPLPHRGRPVSNALIDHLCAEQPE